MRRARGETPKFIIPAMSFSAWVNQKVSEGRDSGTMNSISLGVPFPCLLPLCLVTRYLRNIVRLPRLFVFRGYIDIRQGLTNPPSSEDLFHVSKDDEKREISEMRRKDCTAFLLDGRRLFTRSLNRVSEEIAQNVRGLKGANVRSTNDNPQKDTFECMLQFL